MSKYNHQSVVFTSLVDMSFKWTFLRLYPQSAPVERNKQISLNISVLWNRPIRVVINSHSQEKWSLFSFYFLRIKGSLHSLNIVTCTMSPLYNMCSHLCTISRFTRITISRLVWISRTNFTFEGLYSCMSVQLNVCTVWYELVDLQELQLVDWYEDGSGGKAL